MRSQLVFFHRRRLLQVQAFLLDFLQVFHIRQHLCHLRWEDPLVILTILWDMVLRLLLHQVLRFTPDQFQDRAFIRHHLLHHRRRLLPQASRSQAVMEILDLVLAVLRRLGLNSGRHLDLDLGILGWSVPVGPRCRHLWESHRQTLKVPAPVRRS